MLWHYAIESLSRMLGWCFVLLSISEFVLLADNILGSAFLGPSTGADNVHSSVL